jgi:hypothetical protein
VELIRTLVASYLIATLSATSLAKLKNWRTVSVGVLREMVIPRRAASATIVTVAAVEFLLATLLMLGVQPAVTGFVAAALFLTFGGYRVAVAVRTKSLICTCAGITQSDPASPPAVAGVGFACHLQAGLACTLALLGGRPGGNLLALLTVAAWIAPFITLLTGNWRQSGRLEIDDRFPA